MRLWVNVVLFLRQQNQKNVNYVEFWHFLKPLSIFQENSKSDLTHKLQLQLERFLKGPPFNFKSDKSLLKLLYFFDILLKFQLMFP